MTEFTSTTEIDCMFGASAVELRTDDGSESTIVAEIINQASETVQSYTDRYYDAADLTGSNWVRRRATILAAYYLSSRRGNPTQYTAMVEQITRELEGVAEGKILIPGVAARSVDVPTVSNQTVDDRYRYSKLRTLHGTSTTRYPGQDYYEPPYGGDWP